MREDDRRLRGIGYTPFEIAQLDVSDLYATFDRFTVGLHQQEIPTATAPRIIGNLNARVRLPEKTRL